MSLWTRWTTRRAGREVETFTLREGRVVITFPVHLSEDSLIDMKDYLEIFMRKTQRIGHDPVDEMRPDKRAMAG